MRDVASVGDRRLSALDCLATIRRSDGTILRDSRAVRHGTASALGGGRPEAFKMNGSIGKLATLCGVLAFVACSRGNENTETTPSTNITTTGSATGTETGTGTGNGEMSPTESDPGSSGPSGSPGSSGPSSTPGGPSGSPGSGGPSGSLDSRPSKTRGWLAMNEDRRVFGNPIDVHPSEPLQAAGGRSSSGSGGSSSSGGGHRSGSSGAPAH